MSEHCCSRMSAELSEGDDTDHEDRYASPDALIDYIPKFDEYGMIVHDGGRSMIAIAFCPWCGAQFRESKRDRWFSDLEGKGIDPWSDAVPLEYQTSDWWVKSAP